MTDGAIPSSTARFYRHSGKAPGSAVFGGVVGALVIGGVIGTVFGPLEFAGHLIRFLKLMAVAEVAIVFGAATVLGFLPARLLVMRKSRSMPLAFMCVLIASLVALYFAWAGWLYCLIVYSGGTSTYSFIFAPHHLARYMQLLIAGGAWSIGTNDVPKGAFLVCIWVAEALCIVGGALLAAKKELAKKIFCEGCQTWGVSRHLMQIRDANHAEMQRDLLAGQTGVFDGASVLPAGSLTWCDVTLEGCPTCDNLQALTLTRTVITPTKKGKSTTKTTKLVHRLLLTPDQTAQIAIAAAALGRAGPASPQA